MDVIARVPKLELSDINKHYVVHHYGDVYIGRLVGVSEEGEDCMVLLLESKSEDCAYSPGTHLHVYDLNIKEEVEYA